MCIPYAYYITIQWCISMYCGVVLSDNAVIIASHTQRDVPVIGMGIAIEQEWHSPRIYRNARQANVIIETRSHRTFRSSRSISKTSPSHNVMITSLFRQNGLVASLWCNDDAIAMLRGNCEFTYPRRLGLLKPTSLILVLWIFGILKKGMWDSPNHVQVWQVSPLLSSGDTCQKWK